MTSVLIFDPEATTALEMDPEELSSATESGPTSVLVFDEPDQADSLEAPEDPTGVLVADPVQTDVWIGDATHVTEVLEPADMPDAVVVDDLGTDLLVVEPRGPRGSQGPQGPQGEPSTVPGPPGAGSYYQEFSFATPSRTWLMPHDQHTYGLNVETLDGNGDPIEGEVSYPSWDVIQVDWYYPQSGTGRVFN